MATAKKPVNKKVVKKVEAPKKASVKVKAKETKPKKKKDALTIELEKRQRDIEVKNTRQGFVHTIRKEFKFEMAHKLVESYTPQCKNIHGHSYKVEVELMSNIEDNFGLNKDFMVTDFLRLKQIMSPLIEQLDHSFLVCKDDPILTRGFRDLLKKEKQKVNVSNFNPTAEGLAFYIAQYLASKKLPNEIVVSAVSVFETATSEAQVSMFQADLTKYNKLEILPIIKVPSRTKR